VLRKFRPFSLSPNQKREKKKKKKKGERKIKEWWEVAKSMKSPSCLV